MKIEANRANLESVAAQRADRLTYGRSQQASGSAGTDGTDQVKVSDSAALAETARQAAVGAPEIRQDLVQRMRAKLEAGEVGKDAESLADSMIDSMLESR
jgi:flagellar biosynthesis anti-sigma factor FlgM